MRGSRIIKKKYGGKMTKIKMMKVINKNFDMGKMKHWVSFNRCKTV